MIAAGVIMKPEVLTSPVDVYQSILNSSSKSRIHLFPNALSTGRLQVPHCRFEVPMAQPQLYRP